MRLPVTVIIGLITSLLAGHFVLKEVQRARQCETTYIYEGYKPVDLPHELSATFPRYKLFRYVDGDPSLQLGRLK